MIRTAVSLGFLLLAAGGAPAQDAASKKKALKDIDPVGPWAYDDLNAGYAEARKSNKPMLVVFR